MNWKAWARAAAIRAIKTFAETMISMLTVGRAFVDFDWLHILSVSGVAAVIALLTCIAVLPEVDYNLPLFDEDQLLEEVEDEEDEEWSI